MLADPCPPGSFCPPGTVVECARGTFNPAHGATSGAACLPCEAGTANPLKGMGWYRATKKEFAALPED